jgi:glyoxylase-like metal-dependent hydrolase (beta-lactamase superfamily II)
VPLRPLGPDIWVEEAPHRYLAEMGRRMTVVRLAAGGLWLHSPLPPSDDLAGLGEVRYVVAASSLHGHLSMGDYPAAELFAPPGLARKRRDLRFAGELGDEPDERWAAELDQGIFRGSVRLEEVVFLHRPSRSLIVGDTCFNIRPGAPLLTRLWAWGPRMRPRLGPTGPFRLTVRDRAAARASIDRILAWDFDRLIVGHGEIVESGGREAFRDAWSWL